MKLHSIFFAGALALSLAGAAQAGDWTLGVNLHTWHGATDCPDVYSYQGFTPGIYARYGSDWFAEGGVYRNSQGHVSPHVGGGYRWDLGRIDLALAAGLVYGYRDWSCASCGETGGAKVTAAVIPSIGIKIADGWALRIMGSPALSQGTVAMVSVALEKTL